MEDFKPHLYLKGKHPEFELSIIIPVRKGYHLKHITPPTPVDIPGDPTGGKKHVIQVSFDTDDLDTASILFKTVRIRRGSEIKVVVETITPDKPTGAGSSSAHYADPDK